MAKIAARTYGPVHHHLTMEANQPSIARGTKSPQYRALLFLHNEKSTYK